MLTRRWTQLRPHPEQYRLWTSPARFKTVPAGRRSGKTELGKRKVVEEALKGPRLGFPDARYFLAAPTRDQAKRIFWDDLKQMIPTDLLHGTPSETGLSVRTVLNTEIVVVGLDKPERIEGSPWDGGVITEIANVKPGAWGANIRPALSDRMGWCWLEGVPEGRNHYYDLDKLAKAIAADAQQAGQVPEWDSFGWFSSTVLPESEIASARRDLDELTFQQEYEASFINFTGRAYYPFLERSHCAPLTYNPRAPLVFCFDFNVAPGVAVVCQEQKLPTGREGTGVIGEVWIPRNSNTPAVCRKLAEDWGGHLGKIMCYGDATGGASGSARVLGSDWDLVKSTLRPVFGERLVLRVPSHNPSERARVNAVNSRLTNGVQEVHLMVDPSKAKHTVRDLEGVVLLEGGSGELDKKKDLNLTHLSDALGYYVVYEFPVVPKITMNVEMV